MTFNPKGTFILKTSHCSFVCKALVNLILLSSFASDFQHANAEEPSDAPMVWCGTHSATSCEACGKNFTCDGDCAWTNQTVTQILDTVSNEHEDEDEEADLEMKCSLKIIRCGNYESVHNLFHHCGDCTPLGSEYCTDPSCTWISSTSLCRHRLHDNNTRTATVALLYDLHPPPILQDDNINNPPGPNWDNENIEHPAWLFQKVMVTNAAASSFYGTNGHEFGYAGLQFFEERSNNWKGRIIFSIWDPDIKIPKAHLESFKAQQSKYVVLAACGSSATCTSNADRIEDEGKPDSGNTLDPENEIEEEQDDDITARRKEDDPSHLLFGDSKLSGYTASIEVPLYTNEPYSFMTQASVYLDDSEGNDVDDCHYFDCEHAWIEYSGYVSSVASFGDNNWRFLATVRLSVTTWNSEILYLVPEFKRDWWHQGIYSFIEQWEAKSSFKKRSARFGPSYISGIALDAETNTFSQISSAEYTFDTIENHETVNAYFVPVKSNTGRIVSKTVELSTGGDVEKELELIDSDEDNSSDKDEKDEKDEMNGLIEDGGIYTGDEDVRIRGKRRLNPWTRFNFPDHKQPRELTRFTNRMPCLDGALTTEEIEKCLHSNIP